MKSVVAIAALLLFFWTAQAQAHTLIMTLAEDGEESVEVLGMFSTGAMAMGIPVKVYSKAEDKLLWEGRTDEFGTCLIDRPEVPYEVELDAGPGHCVREEGI